MLLQQPAAQAAREGLREEGPGLGLHHATLLGFPGRGASQTQDQEELEGALQTQGMLHNPN